MRRYDDPVDVRRGQVPGPGGDPVVGPAEDWAESELESGDGDPAPRATQTVDLGAECDVWRVEAGRGPGIGRGVFDLVFDWADGSWRLTRCLD